MSRLFLVCIHDATPAYARETQAMIDDLAPLVGERLSCGVVPDWHGAWPLAAHPEFCRLIDDSSEELLLHGYVHQRRHGWGPVTLLAGSDELNGLDRDETRATLERGQRVMSQIFGRPARGFLPPAWQRGHVLPSHENLLQHLLGFFSLDSAAGQRIPLATWSWDCGRIGWLGHVGHGVGWLMQSMNRGVPVVAIHPNDLHRGFWPRILRLIEQLLAAGFEPTTPSALLEARDAEVAV